MSIFPEHLHLDREDAQLHHVARDDRYRFLLDSYVVALCAGTALFVIAVVLLMLI
jgi:hypothetical protein